MKPNLNPKHMEKMMRSMGIVQTPIDALQVIIQTSDKEIVIEQPQVSKVTMMGQETYQVIGKAKERARKADVEITGEDVDMVMEQTGVDEETARQALKDAKGDLAQAILDLKKD